MAFASQAKMAQAIGLEEARIRRLPADGDGMECAHLAPGHARRDQAARRSAASCSADASSALDMLCGRSKRALTTAPHAAAIAATQHMRSKPLNQG